MFSWLQLLAGLKVALAIPILNESTLEQARGILALDDDSEPTGRLLIGIAAIEKELNEDQLFAMATTHPNIVEMIRDPLFRSALDYIISIPATQRNQLRRGETILRTPEDMDKNEKKAASLMTEKLGMSPKGLKAVRIGAFDATTVSLEVTVKERRKGQVQKYIKLAWPSTLVENEESRNMLTKSFGARPSAPTAGWHSNLPLQSGSFESSNALMQEWGVQTRVFLGAESPIGTVEIDSNQALDGKRSIRFYNTEKTRGFPSVSQWVAIDRQGPLEAQLFIKAEKLRPELQQSEEGVYMQLQFFDYDGNPIGDPYRRNARLGSYEWQLLNLKAEAPHSAASMQIELISSVSGTSWMDALNVFWLE
jgi:hypothetical protein